MIDVGSAEGYRARVMERNDASDAARNPWWELSPGRANLVALILLFLTTIPLLTKIFTSDFGTHLALGRHIVNNLDIPTRELWNYPSLGMENSSGGEWGFQAILYLVYSAGGEYAVSFLCWAVVLGIFLLLHRAAVLRGAHPVLAVLAIFAFSGFLRIRIQPRPEIFTYLFTALTIFLLTEYYFGKRKKLLYLFPPMILLWANIHPTYLMAFVLSGAFFVDALARAAWKREFRWDRIRTWVGPPLVAGVLGLVVCGANPHGYGWLLQPLHLISRGAGSGGMASTVLLSISELTPVKGTGMFVHYKAAATFAAVSLLLGAAGRRIYLLDLLLFAMAFKGAYDSARAVSMMGLFLSPGVSLHLTGFFDRIRTWRPYRDVGMPRKAEAGKKGRKKRKEDPRKNSIPPPRAPADARIVVWSRRAFMGIILASVLVFGGTVTAFSFSQLQFGIGITQHKFSFAAAEFLKRNPIPGNMFNFFDIGGFLDWQLYPQALTFIDGRTYNQKVFAEHQVVTGAQPGWQDVFRRYGVTYVVIKAIDSSGAILPIVPSLAKDPGWTLVFSDGLFLIFVRDIPENQALIQKYGLPKSALPRHIIEESRHYLYLGVSPVLAYQNISNMYLVLGNMPAAIQSLKKALETSDHPFLRSRLLQLEAGRR